MSTTARYIDMTVRLTILAISAFLGIVVLLAGAHMALAADIKPLSIVSGETLTAGDLFNGLDEKKAARVLGRTPLPGSDMVINAPLLLRIATALELPWQPSNTEDRVIVRRAATIISEDSIKDALSAGLKEKGLEGAFNLVLTGTNNSMILPQDQPESVAVKSLRYNPQKDFFEATLVAPSLDNPVTETVIAGKVQRLVQIPVIKNALRAGDIIGAGDISYIDMDSVSVVDGIFLKGDDLIGMTPRRILAAGKPVRDIDIEKPQIVGRGDNVTLVYANGPLILTAKGKSLQGGSKGDRVQVVNAASNRSIEGFVSGDHEITITE